MRLRIELITCLVAAALLAISACNDSQGPAAEPSLQQPYFSLVDYFEKEAARLQEDSPAIVKTVSKDGEEEQKKITVTDWQSEFSLFIDADINKPAWQGSYKVDSALLVTSYVAVDPTLRTREIRVERTETGIISHIRVINQVSNMLYQTDEQLDYYVDSLYRIVKQQQVRIVGESSYTVTGKWQ